MPNITNRPIQPDNYYPEKTKKQGIVLHHTVSSTVDSVYNCWNGDNKHIAVPYIIDKQGIIYETFNPAYWSYHIGGKSTSQDNKNWIGIELVNEGILTRVPVGSKIVYNWTFGEYKGKVFQNKLLWRGSYFFASYTDEQIIATAYLCWKLCRDFGIPNNVIPNLNYSPANINTMGILAHCNLRPDKSDISPAFDFNLFLEKLL